MKIALGIFLKGLMKKDTSKVQFWYPLKTVSQLTFEGSSVVHLVPQEGHILYMGRLMCKQSMERLKAECGAKTNKTVSARINGVKICQICQEKYKLNPDLEWVHWINPPDLKKEANPIPINPRLLEQNNGDKKRCLVPEEPRKRKEDIGGNSEKNSQGSLLDCECSH